MWEPKGFSYLLFVPLSTDGAFAQEQHLFVQLEDGSVLPVTSGYSSRLPDQQDHFLFPLTTCEVSWGTTRAVLGSAAS